jgi:hypothetical protein
MQEIRRSPAVTQGGQLMEASASTCRLYFGEYFLLDSIIFWDMTPCSLLSFNKRFGGTYRLHLPPGCLLVFSEPIPSTLKMEAICSSETVVETQRTIRHHIPEVDTLHNHGSKNLKSYNISSCLFIALSECRHNVRLLRSSPVCFEHNPERNLQFGQVSIAIYTTNKKCYFFYSFMSPNPNPEVEVLFYTLRFAGYLNMNAI